jgi:uncharacterized membrane protein YhhN
MIAAQALTLACLASLAGLLAAERRGHFWARVACKLCASTAFVLVALLLGADQSTYGRWILAALALGWLGDALLLSARSGAFLAGLGAFLLSHLCFAAAFAAGAFSITVFVAALPVSVGFGALVTRWLWPHLTREFRVPVLAYITAILAMCAAAAGFAAASGRWLPLLGALLFTASDLFVARDQFIVRRFRNKAWGLPAYYVAQLLLAWSVAH